jgi:myo-inositol-1(or 4)-monophosphatase
LTCAQDGSGLVEMDQAIRHRINAARVAIRNQLDLFGSQFGNVASDWKADDTRVTFVDFAISEKIFAELRHSFDKDDFCSEESNPLDEVMPMKARYAWVLDPIDGTNNYAMGFTHCAISLALLKQGTPVYGLIYDHSRRELIEGGPQCELLVNGRKATPQIRPFDRRQGVIGMHFPLISEDAKKLHPLITEYRIRSTGSGALNLAYTALGRLDGCFDHKVKVWDIAAAWALVQCTGREFHFLAGDEVFPLKEFHVDAPQLRYCAGGREFCDLILGQLSNDS